MHLAEWRQPNPPRHTAGASIRRPDGTGEWVTWEDVEEDEGDFDQIGADFEITGAAAVGPVGRSTARLMGQRAVVDFASAWIGLNRVTVP
jgi:aminoglycoside 3-N-acetyltransferase